MLSLVKRHAESGQGFDFYNRGSICFQKGLVNLLEVNEDAVVAEVLANKKYTVFLGPYSNSKLKDKICATCTCLEFFDEIDFCEHIWATLFAYEDLLYRRGHSLEIRELVRVYDSAQKNKRAFGMPPATWDQSLASMQAWLNQHGNRVTPQDPSIQRLKEAWYYLNLEEIKRAGALTINFYCREGRPPLKYRKFKELKIDRNKIDSLTYPEDQENIKLLLGNQIYSEYYGSPYEYRIKSSKLAPELYETILPKLAQSGRLVYGDSLYFRPENPESIVNLTWDSGPAYHFKLDLREDKKQQAWQVWGKLVREKEEVDLELPLLILNSGLVFFKDRIARFVADDTFAWITQLREKGLISVPYEQQEVFAQSLYQLVGPNSELIPEQWRYQEKMGTPQPKLLLQPRRDAENHMAAQLILNYGDEEIPFQEPRRSLLNSENQSITFRNFSQEHQALQLLDELGFKASINFVEQGFDRSIHQRDLMKAISQLMNQGWKVAVQGKKIRSISRIDIKVSSDMDWFDIDGEVHFDEMSFSLPKILRALKKGEVFINLSDGSQAILPEELLKKYGKLLNFGKVQDEKIRYSSAQAALIDALLEEREGISFDQGFQETLKKINSFNGIKPTTPAKSFQGDLRKYQKEGLAWLKFLQEFRFGGCLADDMGLGKTVQVLALLEARRGKEGSEPSKASLVVVPRSLVYNWFEEGTRFTPGLKILNYTGTERKGFQKQIHDYHLVLTTYGTLKRDIKFLAEQKFDYVVLDESQAIKNNQSQISKAVKCLQAQHRLAMSGTPVENHLGELWSLFDFLNPGLLGISSNFNKLAKIQNQGEESLRFLGKALKPFILRRTKDQVLKELPPKTEQTLYCELDNKQRKVYNDLKKHYQAGLLKKVKQEGIAKSKIMILEALLRLRQAATHPGLIDSKKASELSAKQETFLEQLSEILEEGHKVLVFSQFTKMLEIIRRSLERKKITYAYLDGQTKKRQAAVEQFQNDPKCQVFLISIKAGGFGLNLTAAEYIFILDPWWNPAVESQAIDRAHRMGQTKHVFAYRLIAKDTVEEKILKLQEKKKGLAEAVISESGSVLKSLKKEDLEFLLS